MQKMSKEKDDLKIQKRKQNVLDEATSSKFAKTTNTGTQQSITGMLNNKETADASVARGFYRAGIPFNVINKPALQTGAVGHSKVWVWLYAAVRVLHAHITTQ